MRTFPHIDLSWEKYMRKNLRFSRKWVPKWSRLRRFAKSCPFRAFLAAGGNQPLDRIEWYVRCLGMPTGSKVSISGPGWVLWTLPGRWWTLECGCLRKILRRNSSDLLQKPSLSETLVFSEYFLGGWTAQRGFRLWLITKLSVWAQTHSIQESFL